MDELKDQIEDFKTDESELSEVLDKFDLDESLATEFDSIVTDFQQLQIKYQSLINTRRFLLDAQSQP